MLVFEKASGDRESESGSVIRTIACRGSANARFEDVWKKARVDSGPVILDRDLDGRFADGVPGDVDRGASRAVPHCVVQDVRDSAFEAVAVDDDADCLVAIELEPVVSEAGRVLEAGRDLLEQFADGATSSWGAGWA